MPFALPLLATLSNVTNMLPGANTVALAFGAVSIIPGLGTLWAHFNNGKPIQNQDIADLLGLEAIAFKKSGASYVFENIQVINLEQLTKILENTVKDISKEYETDIEGNKKTPLSRDELKKRLKGAINTAIQTKYKITINPPAHVKYVGQIDFGDWSKLNPTVTDEIGTTITTEPLRSNILSTLTGIPILSMLQNNVYPDIKLEEKFAEASSRPFTGWFFDWAKSKLDKKIRRGKASQLNTGLDQQNKDYPSGLASLLATLPELEASNILSKYFEMTKRNIELQEQLERLKIGMALGEIEKNKKALRKFYIAITVFAITTTITILAIAAVAVFNPSFAILLSFSAGSIVTKYGWKVIMGTVIGLFGCSMQLRGYYRENINIAEHHVGDYNQKLNELKEFKQHLEQEEHSLTEHNILSVIRESVQNSSDLRLEAINISNFTMEIICSYLALKKKSDPGRALNLLLCKCTISTEGIRRLATTLSTHSTYAAQIQTIDLTDAIIEATGLNSILEALQTNCTLTEIKFPKSISAQDPTVVKIKQQLEANKYLQGIPLTATPNEASIRDAAIQKTRSNFQAILNANDDKLFSRFMEFYKKINPNPTSDRDKFLRECFKNTNTDKLIESIKKDAPTCSQLSQLDKPHCRVLLEQYFAAYAPMNKEDAIKQAHLVSIIIKQEGTDLAGVDPEENDALDLHPSTDKYYFVENAILRKHFQNYEDLKEALRKERKILKSSKDDNTTTIKRLDDILQTDLRETLEEQYPFLQPPFTEPTPIQLEDFKKYLDSNSELKTGFSDQIHPKVKKYVDRIIAKNKLRNAITYPPEKALKKLTDVCKEMDVKQLASGLQDFKNMNPKNKDKLYDLVKRDIKNNNYLGLKSLALEQRIELLAACLDDSFAYGTATLVARLMDIAKPEGPVTLEYVWRIFDWTTADSWVFEKYIEKLRELSEDLRLDGGDQIATHIDLDQIIQLGIQAVATTTDRLIKQSELPPQSAREILDRLATVEYAVMIPEKTAEEPQYVTTLQPPTQSVFYRSLALFSAKQDNVQAFIKQFSRIAPNDITLPPLDNQDNQQIILQFVSKHLGTCEKTASSFKIDNRENFKTYLDPEFVMAFDPPHRQSLLKICFAAETDAAEKAALVSNMLEIVFSEDFDYSKNEDLPLVKDIAYEIYWAISPDTGKNKPYHSLAKLKSRLQEIVDKAVAHDDRYQDTPSNIRTAILNILKSPSNTPVLKPEKDKK